MVGSDGMSGALGVVAWVVAGGLAVGAGGAALAVVAHRRSRDAEGRSRRLERAAADFCAALRARVALERSRARRADGGGEPEADEIGGTGHPVGAGQCGGSNLAATSSSASPSSRSPRAPRSGWSGEQQRPSA
jgi:hypothetical protein